MNLRPFNLPKNIRDLLKPTAKAELQRAGEMLESLQRLQLVIRSGGEVSAGSIQITRGAALLQSTANLTIGSVFLSPRPDLGLAPILESPIPWGTGNSTGSFTFASSLVINGSGVSDFNGDQWLLAQSRFGSTIGSALSAQAVAGGQTLVIGNQTWTWVSGDIVLAAWFSTNGGSVPTYVRYYGGFTVFKIYAYGMKPGQLHRVRVTMLNTDYSGANPVTTVEDFSFTPSGRSNAVILQVPTVFSSSSVYRAAVAQSVRFI